MTGASNVKLLPLPSSWDVWIVQKMEDYARACVEANTEALQAEIEALRAEVTALQREVGALHMHAKQRDQYAVEKAVQALDWKKRAERLTEALRGWWKMRRPVGWTEDQHRTCPHVNLATDAEKALATALLRDQETTNG